VTAERFLKTTQPVVSKREVFQGVVTNKKQEESNQLYFQLEQSSFLLKQIIQ
jgi:hypothetical protein